MKDFPSKPLTVSNKKLFCTACRKQLSLKKSTTELHVKSVKHTRGKERFILKEKRQLDIAASLNEYDREFHPGGETLPDAIRIFRVNVLTALLKTGVPLSKMDKLSRKFTFPG